MEAGRGLDWLSHLGFAMGAAWLSGIRLYAMVLTLGLLERFHLATLPGDMAVVGRTWVIAVSAVLFLIEFLADKIPAIDSAWDAVHTFIRIPAGAILAASAFAHFDPSVRVAALLIGGGIALSSHGAKAATRLAVNTSPEPFSNLVVSLLEDAFTVGAAILMAFHPVVILTMVAVFLAVLCWIGPKIYGAIGRLFRRKKPAMAA